jgi:hypothetical protein
MESGEHVNRILTSRTLVGRITLNDRGRVEVRSHGEKVILKLLNNRVTYGYRRESRTELAPATLSFLRLRSVVDH